MKNNKKAKRTIHPGDSLFFSSKDMKIFDNLRVNTKNKEWEQLMKDVMYSKHPHVRFIVSRISHGINEERCWHAEDGILSEFREKTPHKQSYILKEKHPTIHGYFTTNMRVKSSEFLNGKSKPKDPDIPEFINEWAIPVFTDKPLIVNEEVYYIYFCGYKNLLGCVSDPLGRATDSHDVSVLLYNPKNKKKQNKENEQVEKED